MEKQKLKIILLSSLLGGAGALVGTFLTIFLLFNVSFFNSLFGIITGGLAGIGLAIGYKLAKGSLKNDEFKLIVNFPIPFGAVSALLVIFLPFLFFNLLVGITWDAYTVLYNFGIVDVLFVIVSAIAAKIAFAKTLKFVYRDELLIAEEKRMDAFKKELEKLSKKKDQKKPAKKKG